MSSLGGSSTVSILLEAFLEGLNEGGQQGHPKVVRQTPRAHSLQEQTEAHCAARQYLSGPGMCNKSLQLFSL